MWQLINRFKKQNSGSISIEFAIIIPFLIFLFLFSLEMGRLMLIGSSLDLVSTEISRKTAITENIIKNSNDYSEIFNNQLTQDIPLWPILTSKDDFNINVKFCKSIQEVIDDNCKMNLANDHQIILFELNYQYSAIFSTLFSELVNTSLNKKTVLYREFYS